MDNLSSPLYQPLLGRCAGHTCKHNAGGKHLDCQCPLMFPNIRLKERNYYYFFKAAAKHGESWIHLLLSFHFDLSNQIYNFKTANPISTRFKMFYFQSVTWKEVADFFFFMAEKFGTKCLICCSEASENH